MSGRRLGPWDDTTIQVRKYQEDLYTCERRWKEVVNVAKLATADCRRDLQKKLMQELVSSHATLYT
jgi:hypothetical protein